MITGYEEQVRSIAAQIAGTVIEDHAYGIRWKQAVDGFADAGMTSAIRISSRRAVLRYPGASRDRGGGSGTDTREGFRLNLVVVPVDYSENVCVLMDELADSTRTLCS
jgi:acetolactate synthase-1/2/3 large subunit